MMMPNRRRQGTHQGEAIGRLIVRLLRDDSGVTSLQYLVAAVALALVAVAAYRPIAGVLASLLARIHIIAALATP